MDIIVTTPKTQIKAAAAEAADCIADGGGEYFRRFPKSWRINIRASDRVYYVEDGYIRGFAIVNRFQFREYPETCQTTGRVWDAGRYIYMDATTWRWIRPIPMRGFQGFRYAPDYLWHLGVRVIGGWLDRKPATETR